VSHLSRPQILVVDDDASIRDSFSMLLSAAGCDVTTAEHGFDALLRLRRTAPDIILSDLNMPQMSGFEFLSILRRRFPDVLVIAMSGAYRSGDGVPSGVIADAFHAKGSARPEELLNVIDNLIETRMERTSSHHQQSAPVWIPRNGKDSQGIPFIVLTCTECLRSFPISVLEEGLQEIQETPCQFCETPVRYIIDFSRAVSSPEINAKSAAAAPSWRTA
jgi:CheY-like chemotaxis protein